MVTSILSNGYNEQVSNGFQCQCAGVKWLQVSVWQASNGYNSMTGIITAGIK